MPSCNYRIQVPGKLFIAGEYAVLEPDQQAIVIAVDRYITATVSSSDKNIISLPDIGFDQVIWESEREKVRFDHDDVKLRFVQHAIQIVHQYLYEHDIQQRPFRLMITSELDDKSGKKLGLGSSAAIVVAVVSAMLQQYREKITISNDIVFKLATIAHLQTQGNGSGADVAASTYGGWLCYAAFQPSWIHEQMQQEMPVKELVAKDWPHLHISRIKAPSHLQLCVGWTGDAASTGPMVKRILTLKETDESFYNQFLQASSSAVSQLVKSFEMNDHQGAIASLTENRKALVELGAHTDVPIETVELRKLADIAENYGSGKSSGAGGGDCGIAFVTGEQQVGLLRQAWADVNITMLDLKVSPNGANYEVV
ncbi:phosphomevalonate kinase [Aquibacillus sediminis]|uniref:phosphomevalonate kinase n=1 Tax=Aquibacillus sediminis TaxID=2574734 RepID=UPI0014871425|nr:phosphomevalonate kinase [Aquibacillus sediminis]